MKLAEMGIVTIRLTGRGMSPYESVIIQLKTDDEIIELGEAPVFPSYLSSNVFFNCPTMLNVNTPQTRLPSFEDFA